MTPLPPGSAHVLFIAGDGHGTRRARECLVALHPRSLQVTHLETLDAGVSMLTDATIEALVLDLPIAGQCSLAACRTLRAAAPHAAIVLNATPDHEATAVEALREGADGYVLTGDSDGLALACAVSIALRRARAEAELRDQHQRHLALLDLLDDGVASLDQSGRIVTANPAIARMLGYEHPHELTGMALGTVYAGPDSIEALLGDLATTGKIPRTECELLCRDGGRLTVLLRGRTLAPHTSEQAAFEIICTNITAERHLEEQARHDTRLVLGGTLAAGVAVDLQRLMAAASATHDLLAEAIGESHPRRHDLQHLRDTTAAAARLIEELLASTRRRTLRSAAVDAGAVLERLWPSLQQTYGDDITLRLPSDGAAGQVTATPAELDHVILELASIMRVLEPYAPFTIATAPVYLDATYAREHLALVPGHYVSFLTTAAMQSLESLIPPDWQAERYFSPNVAERQVALELATVHQFVKQNGGHLTIRRSLGAGTTLKVYLPRTDTPGRLGTILLVEDEPSIRSGGRQLLELLDYRVLEAGDPHEAIWLASRYDGVIDLLIADVVLPGMNGREMAERLLASGRVSHVLYMSGLLKETLVSRAALPPDVKFIEKPFTARELATRVAEVLGGSR